MADQDQEQKPTHVGLADDWDLTEVEEKNGDKPKPPKPIELPAEMSSLHKQIWTMKIYEAAHAAQVKAQVQEPQQPAQMCEHNMDCNWYIRFLAYVYTEEGMNHFAQFKHDLQPCHHGLACYARNRLINHGHRLDDRAHCAVFKHE